MKKLLALTGTLLVALTCSSCGKEATSNTESFSPDISIEEINWSVGSGTVKGDNYVVMEYTNNSQLTIDSLTIQFTEKDGVTDDQRTALYSDIQQSQGFDDEYMSKWIESKTELNQPITMYGKCDNAVTPGQTSEQIKCYYYGGWTSKNVLHSDLLTPEKAEIHYEKDGIAYILYYNFESKLYKLEQE